MPLFTPPDPRTPPALTATESGNLIKQNTLKAYLSVIPSTLPTAASGYEYKGTGIVNLPSGAPTWVMPEIPIRTADSVLESARFIAGTYTSHSIMGSVWIGTTAGGSEIGIFPFNGYLAIDTGAHTGTLLIDDSSIVDTGILPVSLRNVPLADGQYVTVFLGPIDIYSALTRIVPPSSFYKNYRDGYLYETIASPVILNLGPNIATFCDPGASYYTAALHPKMIRWTGTEGVGTVYNLVWSPLVSSGYTVVGTDYLNGATFTETSGTIQAGPTIKDQFDSGAAHACQVTLRLNPGFHIFKVYAYYTATGSGSGGTWATGGSPVTPVSNAYRMFWVHDGVLGDAGVVFPAIPISRVLSDSRDSYSRSISLEINSTNLNNPIKLGICQYWEDATWGVAGTDYVPSATTRLTGWITSENTTGENGLATTQITIDGLGAMLDKVPASSNLINFKTTLGPSDSYTWQDVMWPLYTGEYLLFYLLKYHTIGVMDLFDFNPFAAPMQVKPAAGTVASGVGTVGGGSTVFWYDYDHASILHTPPTVSPIDNAATGAPLLPSRSFEVQTGTLLSQLKKVASQIGLNIGIDSNGAIWIRPHPSILPYSNRDKVPVRDVIDSSIFSKVEFGGDTFAKVRKVNGGAIMIAPFVGGGSSTAFYWLGGFFISAAGLSVWPGGSMAHGQIEQNNSDYMLSDQTHLNSIIGNTAAMLNNPLPSIRVTIPGNRDVYEPAHYSLVALRIPDYLTSDNTEIYIRAAVKSVNKRYLSNETGGGSADIELELEGETAGMPGLTQAVPGLITVPPPPPTGGGTGGTTPPISGPGIWYAGYTGFGGTLSAWQPYTLGTTLTSAPAGSPLNPSGNAEAYMVVYCNFNLTPPTTLTDISGTTALQGLVIDSFTVTGLTTVFVGEAAAAHCSVTPAGGTQTFGVTPVAGNQLRIFEIRSGSQFSISFTGHNP